MPSYWQFNDRKFRLMPVLYLRLCLKLFFNDLNCIFVKTVFRTGSGLKLRTRFMIEMFGTKSNKELQNSMSSVVIYTSTRPVMYGVESGVRTW